MMAEPAAEAKPASQPPTSFASTDRHVRDIRSGSIFGEETAPADGTPVPAFEPSAGAPSADADRAGPASYDFSEPLAAEAERYCPMVKRPWKRCARGSGSGKGQWMRSPGIRTSCPLSPRYGIAGASRRVRLCTAAAPVRPAAIPPAARVPESPLSAAGRAPEGTEELLMNVAKDCRRESRERGPGAGRLGGHSRTG